MPSCIIISFWLIENRGNKFHTHWHWAMLSLEITCDRPSDRRKSKEHVIPPPTLTSFTHLENTEDPTTPPRKAWQTQKTNTRSILSSTIKKVKSTCTQENLKGEEVGQTLWLLPQSRASGPCGYSEGMTSANREDKEGAVWMGGGQRGRDEVPVTSQKMEASPLPGHHASCRTTCSHQVCWKDSSQRTEGLGPALQSLLVLASEHQMIKTTVTNLTWSVIRVVR